jgi:hypothetical protein
MLPKACNTVEAVIAMKKYPLNRSIRNEYSLKHFNIRSTKDAHLFDDVEDFIKKNNVGLDSLVDKLVNNHFSHARYTDPEHPQL